jgi:hypothetical protein
MLNIQRAKLFGENFGIKSYHINHTLSIKKRLPIIDAVRQASEAVLLTNANSLTYGFDMPETV